MLFPSGWRFWHYTWSFTCYVQRSVLSLGGTWICVNLQMVPLVGQEPMLTQKIVTTPKVEEKKKKTDVGKDGRQEQKVEKWVIEDEMVG